MILSGEIKAIQKKGVCAIYSFSSVYIFVSLEEVRPSMTKEQTSMTIEGDLLDLARKLKINRSEAAEKGIRQEIALKLRTLDLDVENFKNLAGEYLVEQKRQDDHIILAGQRLEQEAYARERDRELRAEQERNLLAEWHTFCAAHRLRESQFAAFLRGDVDGWKDHSREEALLIQALAQKGLPSDLNLLRPLLRNAPLQVVRK
jgi:post-segregation antitoxin (ccd killing protein)